MTSNLIHSLLSVANGREIIGNAVSTCKIHQYFPIPLKFCASYVDFHHSPLAIISM